MRLACQCELGWVELAQRWVRAKSGYRGLNVSKEDTIDGVALDLGWRELWIS